VIEIANIDMFASVTGAVRGSNVQTSTASSSSFSDSLVAVSKTSDSENAVVTAGDRGASGNRDSKEATAVLGNASAPADGKVANSGQAITEKEVAPVQGQPINSAGGASQSVPSATDVIAQMAGLTVQASKSSKQIKSTKDSVRPSVHTSGTLPKIETKRSQAVDSTATSTLPKVQPIMTAPVTSLPVANESETAVLAPSALPQSTSADAASLAGDSLREPAPDKASLAASGIPVGLSRESAKTTSKVVVGESKDSVQPSYSNDLTVAVSSTPVTGLASGTILPNSGLAPSTSSSQESNSMTAGIPSQEGNVNPSSTKTPTSIANADRSSHESAPSKAVFGANEGWSGVSREQAKTVSQPTVGDSKASAQSIKSSEVTGAVASAVSVKPDSQVVSSGRGPKDAVSSAANITANVLPPVTQKESTSPSLVTKPVAILSNDATQQTLTVQEPQVASSEGLPVTSVASDSLNQMSALNGTVQVKAAPFKQAQQNSDIEASAKNSAGASSDSVQKPVAFAASNGDSVVAKSSSPNVVEDEDIHTTAGRDTNAAPVSATEAPLPAPAETLQVNSVNDSSVSVDTQARSASLSAASKPAEISAAKAAPVAVDDGSRVTTASEEWNASADFINLTTSSMKDVGPRAAMNVLKSGAKSVGESVGVLSSKVAVAVSDSSNPKAADVQSAVAPKVPKLSTEPVSTAVDVTKAVLKANAVSDSRSPIISTEKDVQVSVPTGNVKAALDIPSKSNSSPAQYTPDNAAGNTPGNVAQKTSSSAAQSTPGNAAQNTPDNTTPRVAAEATQRITANPVQHAANNTLSSATAPLKSGVATRWNQAERSAANATSTTSSVVPLPEAATYSQVSGNRSASGLNTDSMNQAKPLVGNGTGASTGTKEATTSNGSSKPHSDAGSSQSSQSQSDGTSQPADQIQPAVDPHVQDVVPNVTSAANNGSVSTIQPQSTVNAAPLRTTETTAAHGGPDTRGVGVATPTPASVAHASPVINSAKLIQSMGQSEMRVGMRSNEFGSISITTSSTRELVSAQISLDHGELAKTLATHLPEMQASLGGNQPASVRIDLNGAAGGQNAGMSGSMAQDSTDSSRGGRQQGSTTASSFYAGRGANDRQSSVVSAGMGSGDGMASARLDIRI
jgi:hypothetical protein